MGSVTFIRDRSTTEIVARSLDGNNMFTDYSIFKNGAQNIDCYVGCLASGSFLLKPNIVNIMAPSWLFSKKNGPKTSKYQKPQQSLVWGHWLLQCDSWIFWILYGEVWVIHMWKWVSNVFSKKELISAKRSSADWTNRKHIGWSWGFSFWTSWTLYSFIVRSLYKILLNAVWEMLNFLRTMTCSCWGLSNERSRWNVHILFCPITNQFKELAS